MYSHDSYWTGACAPGPETDSFSLGSMFRHDQKLRATQRPAASHSSPPAHCAASGQQHRPHGRRLKRHAGQSAAGLAMLLMPRSARFFYHFSVSSTTTVSNLSGALSGKVIIVLSPSVFTERAVLSLSARR